MEEQNARLTTSLSAIYHRKGMGLCSWLPTNGTTLFCLCTCRIQNPDIVRIGSERPAKWPGGVGQDWMSTELFAEKTKVHRSLQGIEEMSS